MYKNTLLDNNIRLASANMPYMRSAAIGVWINTGGRYENTDNKGISHFLEHLLFKGSRKYSCRKLKESIEGVGGALNGFTSEEFTCYLVKIPVVHADRALDILSDMVLHPLLPEVEVEKERTVILEEIKMYKDLPQSYVHELLDELLWPQHPLGMNITGTIQTVKDITVDDLRVYKRNNYTAENIIVSVAGPLSHSWLTKKAKEIFCGLAKRRENSFVKAEALQDKPRLKLFFKQTEQSHLTVGFPGYNRTHPLRHALALLHIILGANMSSRLFNEVREKRGLAYEIGTQVKRFHDTGAFIIHAGIDNRKIIEAIQVILKELSRVKDSPVSKDEFKRAKEFYLGQLMLGLEDTLEHMLWIGESVASFKRIISYEEVLKEVNAVRIDDIRQVAREIFKQCRINLAMISPVTGIENKIEQQFSF